MLPQPGAPSWNMPAGAGAGRVGHLRQDGQAQGYEAGHAVHQRQGGLAPASLSMRLTEFKDLQFVLEPLASDVQCEALLRMACARRQVEGDAEYLDSLSFSCLFPLLFFSIGHESCRQASRSSIGFAAQECDWKRSCWLRWLA